MARLIDADALIDAVKNKIAVDKEIYPYDKSSIIFRTGMKNVIGIVKNQDTVDPVKHGHWKFVRENVSSISCSRCECHICWVNAKRPNYCPNCGIKMDEKPGGDKVDEKEEQKE